MFSCRQISRMEVGLFNNIERERVTSRQEIKLADRMSVKIHFQVGVLELCAIARHSQPTRYIGNNVQKKLLRSPLHPLNIRWLVPVWSFPWVYSERPFRFLPVHHNLYHQVSTLSPAVRNMYASVECRGVSGAVVHVPEKNAETVDTNDAHLRSE
jgi:hypothetical protein